MTLKAKEFIALRKKAMMDRRERYEKRQHEMIVTVAEIAQKLKDTPMINGKDT